MGSPYFVGLSEAHSGHSRAKTYRYSRTITKEILARHSDSRWVMVLPQDGPWADVTSAGGKRAGSGEAYDLSEKVTPTIVSDPTGFQWIDFLSPHTKFNESYYVTNILCPFAVWRDTQVRKTDRKLIIHSDNARPHINKKTFDFLELNGMERAPHPPYSPDLTPCDSYLLDYIKQVLASREFAERKGFLEMVMAILNVIPWRKYFATEWQDLSKIFRPKESMLSGKSYDLKRFYWSLSNFELLMVWWDTLYMLKRNEFIEDWIPETGVIKSVARRSMF
jgi:hypothetical protein